MNRAIFKDKNKNPFIRNNFIICFTYLTDKKFSGMKR